MRRLIVLLAALFIPLFAASTAAAFDPLDKVCEETPNAAACQEPATNPLYGPDGVITRVIMIVSLAVGVVSVIMVILGGFKYVTSNGDSNAITSAKNTILYALIGLAIAASAQFIVRFVLNRVTS